MGFLEMTPERHREIACMGGRAVHVKGTAHKWTSETARVAGLKGGLVYSARCAVRRAQAEVLRRYRGERP